MEQIRLPHTFRIIWYIMFWCSHKPHWELNQLCDCSFCFVTCLPPVSKMVTMVYLNPRHCSRVKRNALLPPLLSDLPICSYQILACLLGHNLVRTSRVILMWDFRTLHRKFKLYLWFKLRWGNEMVRTRWASNSVRDTNYFYFVLLVSPCPNSR